MCGLKSSVLKTIKRSSSGALSLIHELLFSDDYSYKDQVQDEFRGLEASAFIAMDLASHYKEMSKKKKGVNIALDILVFIKVSSFTLKHTSLKERISL
jgi:hypothetical protein